MNIIKKHIPGVVRNSYVGGKPTTIVLHETANQHSTIDNESDFVNRNWRNAFFHYLVSDSAIYEKADPNYLAWGAGPNINGYAIHIELVRNNGKNFNQAYANYIWLARKLAKDYNIPIVFNKQRNGIVTHHWVSLNLGGTDHTDPDAWLAQNGVSLSKLENDLKKGEEGMKATWDYVRKVYQELLGRLPKDNEKGAQAYVGKDAGWVFLNVYESAEAARFRNSRAAWKRAHDNPPVAKHENVKKLTKGIYEVE